MNIRLFSAILCVLFIPTGVFAQHVGKSSSNSNPRLRSNAAVRVIKDSYIIDRHPKAAAQTAPSAALSPNRRFKVVSEHGRFSKVKKITSSAAAAVALSADENLCPEILQEFPDHRCTPDYALQMASDVSYEPNDEWYYPRPDLLSHPTLSELALGQQKDFRAIGAPNAWGGGNRGSCTNPSIVGVIDSGVNYLHPDLAPNMWVNSAEEAGRPGRDDDFNGYIDDIHGINLTTHVDGLTIGDPMDTIGHGSHIAGTIGARGNDRFGAAGVNWCVQIVAIKIFPDVNNEAALSNAIRAIDYLTDLKTRQGYNVVLSNNSWGVASPGNDIPPLKEAIARANAAGIMFVAAAMNSSLNIDTNPWYPASYDGEGILTVSATDSTTGQLASFSNYGSRFVDIAAPGVSILSTTVGPTPGGSYYNSMYGTSMAAPFVSGALAMFHAKYPGSSITTLRNHLLNNATINDSLIGKVAGGKFLNLSSMFPQATATATPFQTQTAAPTATYYVTARPALSFTPTPTLTPFPRATIPPATSTPTLSPTLPPRTPVSTSTSTATPEQDRTVRPIYTATSTPERPMVTSTATRSVPTATPYFTATQVYPRTPPPTATSTSTRIIPTIPPATATATRTPFPRLVADILVSSRNQLSAYNFDGSSIAAIEIPYGAGTRSIYNAAGDLVVLPTEKVVLFNGAKDPYLSTFNLQSSEWQHSTHAEWNTDASYVNSGIAGNAQTIFLADASPDGQGILAFSLTRQIFTRFAETINPTDLALLGNELYALVDKNKLFVYDTRTLSLTRTVHLDRSIISFAVSPAGEIFGAADYGEKICKFTAAGRSIKSRRFRDSTIIDMNISSANILIAGTQEGEIIMSDLALYRVNTHQLPTMSPVFVDFAVP